MDAITQLLEAYVCRRANPLTDALCLDGLRRASTALRRACNEPNDLDARSDMSYAALLSGVALANAGLARRSWLRGATGRDVRRSARGHLRRPPSPRHDCQYCRLAGAGRDPTGATLGAILRSLAFSPTTLTPNQKPVPPG